jgi:hypothetical protein
MPRIVIALVVIGALAVPSLGAAGTATKQVQRNQVATVHVASGIPEYGDLRLPKPAPRQKAARTYQLLTSSSDACGVETFRLVVNGRAGLPMC